METDGSFELSIELTERERGRDPHSNTYEIHVDGTHVRYRGPYGEGERGRYGTESVEFDLTDDQRFHLDLQLDSFDLRQSVTERFHTDTGGKQSRGVDAEATITTDGETHELRIEGVMNVRGEDTDMEHHEQARGLRTLCREFKTWAEESEK